MKTFDRRDQIQIENERSDIVSYLEDRLELPMVVLGFVWLGLLVLELVQGLSLWMEYLGTAIWIVFILDFALKFFLAPRKIDYLKQNWLTAIALGIPALRVFRVARAFRLFRMARVARGTRLIKVISSVNRGIKALGATMARRGFGYVVLITVIVAFAGAAGMFTFENENPDGVGLNDYGTALWWTVMLLTSLGSEYWPRSTEGRLLCFFLALYGFAMFGYVTATLATFFVGRDADSDEAEVVGAKDIKKLQDEIAMLREAIIKMQPPN